MAKRSNEFDFQVATIELDEVLAKLQDPTVEVDEAVKLYETGQRLITELEDYLQHAENTVRKLSAGAE